MNTAALLAQLNTLRANAGKAPLASWKQSRAKLEEAIVALTPAAPVTQATRKGRKSKFKVKGIFKSKVPAMKNERGKTWNEFQLRTNVGDLTASQEANGTYFYFTSDETVYSAKASNFADLMKDGVLDLRSGH